LELGCANLAANCLKEYGPRAAIEAVPRNVGSCIETALQEKDLTSLRYLLERAIDWQQPQLVLDALQQLPNNTSFQPIEWVARLWLNQLDPPPLGEKMLVPYGCWLVATQGPAAARAHFGQIVEEPYPRTWTLLGHYLLRGSEFRHTWRRQAFWWERQQLYRQLALYYHCARDERKSQRYMQLVHPRTGF
jgi:hypothetical protein